MPIYEYKCDKCGDLFSALVMSYANDAVKCPSCGSTEVTKKLSAFSCACSSGGAGSFSGGG